jgi:MFS family permease
MGALPITATRRLLANGRLTAVVLASGVSGVGDWLYLTVLPLLVYRETSDPVIVGLIGSARLLPWLLLSIPAGALVDRVPGPQLLIATDLSRAALMFLMAILSSVHAPFAGVLLAALAAVIAGTVAMPAHGRLLPTLARSDLELETANVVSATLGNLACVLGPGIAVVLAVAGGIEAAFVLNGISFLVVVGVMFRVRPLLGARVACNASRGIEEPASEHQGGLITIMRASANRLLVDAAVSFTSAALWVLPVLAVSALALGDAIVGLVAVLGGAGGIAGALMAGRFMGGRQNRGMVLGIAFMAIGIAVAPLGSSVVVLVVGLTISAGALVTVDTLNVTMLQQATPPDRLGRTLGILHTTAAASAMVGAAVPGVAFSALGPCSACALTAMLVGLCGIAALGSSQIGARARRDQRSSAVPERSLERMLA